MRTDPCIVCPSCERALSPLDFDHEGIERPVLVAHEDFEPIRRESYREFTELASDEEQADAS